MHLLARKRIVRWVTAPLAVIVATAVPVSVTASAAATTSVPSVNHPTTIAEAGKVVVSVKGPIPNAVGDTTRGVNGHTITVEGSADVTAGGQTSLPGVCAGAEARFAAANKAGGVGGYKIHYVGCDDSQTSQTVALQNVQKAVDVDHAFAIVPLQSETLNPQFLNQNHVPYFGIATGPSFCSGDQWKDVSWGFGGAGTSCTGNLTPTVSIQGSYPVTALVNALSGKLAPAKMKWAFVGDNLSFLESAQNVQSTIVKQLGYGKVVYNGIPVPGPGAPALTDYTPLAQKIIDSGANIVAMTYVSAPGIYALIQSLKANGFKGVIYSEVSLGVTDPATLANPTLAGDENGTYVALTPVGQATVAPKQVAVIAQQLKAIGSNVNPSDETTVESWLSADFFLDAVAHVKGPLTTEKLDNMLNEGDYTYPGVPGLAGPVAYPASRVLTTNYAGMEKIENGKIVGVSPLSETGVKVFYVPVSS